MKGFWTNRQIIFILLILAFTTASKNDLNPSNLYSGEDKDDGGSTTSQEISSESIQDLSENQVPHQRSDDNIYPPQNWGKDTKYGEEIKRDFYRPLNPKMNSHVNTFIQGHLNHPYLPINDITSPNIIHTNYHHHDHFNSPINQNFPQYQDPYGPRNYINSPYNIQQPPFSGNSGLYTNNNNDGSHDNGEYDNNGRLYYAQNPFVPHYTQNPPTYPHTQKMPPPSYFWQFTLKTKEATCDLAILSSNSVQQVSDDSSLWITKGGGFDVVISSDSFFIRPSHGLKNGQNKVEHALDVVKRVQQKTRQREAQLRATTRKDVLGLLYLKGRIRTLNGEESQFKIIAPNEKGIFEVSNSKEFDTNTNVPNGPILIVPANMQDLPEIKLDDQVADIATKLSNFPTPIIIIGVPPLTKQKLPTTIVRQKRKVNKNPKTSKPKIKKTKTPEIPNNQVNSTPQVQSSELLPVGTIDISKNMAFRYILVNQEYENVSNQWKFMINFIASPNEVQLLRDYMPITRYKGSDIIVGDDCFFVRQSTLETYKLTSSTSFLNMSAEDFLTNLDHGRGWDSLSLVGLLKDGDLLGYYRGISEIILYHKNRPFSLFACNREGCKKENTKESPLQLHFKEEDMFFLIVLGNLDNVPGKETHEKLSVFMTRLLKETNLPMMAIQPQIIID